MDKFTFSAKSRAELVTVLHDIQGAQFYKLLLNYYHEVKFTQKYMQSYRFRHMH